MRVLFISANREQFPDPVFPIGLSYMASATRQCGHEVQVLDLCFRKDYVRALENTLARFNPQVIGIALRNIDNAFYPLTISYIPFYREVIHTCHRGSSATIVLGGSAFTIMRKTMLDYLDADLGVVGEGEEVFPYLLDKIEAPHVLESMPWLVRRGDKQRDTVPASLNKPLDELPMPARDLFPHHLYFRWGGMGNIQTKRGCAFNCIYCTYPLIEGRLVRMRSPQGVAEEIEYLVEGLRQRRLFIVDSIFNNPPQHAEAICAEIIRRKLKFSWSCFATPGLIPESLAWLMARAGCTGVELGTDAAHAGMLSNLGKDFSVDDIVRSTKICRAAGLEVCHTLLFGGPGETQQSIKATCELMDSLDATAIIALTGVRIYPHTALADIALKELGLCAEERFPEPLFYVSPEVRDFMLEFLVSFAAKRGRWVLPGLHPPIKTGLHRILRGLGVKLPLWELLKYRAFRNRAKLPGLRLP